MKERIHEQLSEELRHSTRSDTATIIVSIVVTFILMGFALGFAYNTVENQYSIDRTVRYLNNTSTIITFVCIAAIIVVNFFAVRGILKNKKRISSLNEGLMKMYREEGLDKYFNGALSEGLSTRHNVFAIILTTLAAVAVILPLVAFVHEVVKL